MEIPLTALAFCGLFALVSSALLPYCARRLAWLAAALALAGTPAQAQSVQLDELKATREGGALVVTARLTLALPEVVQDALRRGVPVFFEADAEVRRRHRYWFNRRLARERRYMRLAYQPLTRHWVLSTSARPFDEGAGGHAISTAFDTMDEALAAVGRMERWQVASAAQLAGGGRQALRFRFKLDTKRLPRAIQVGAIGPGASGWTLAEQREIALGRAPAQAAPGAAAASAASAAAPASQPASALLL
ncbi:MAG: DUF4390 domain-containing protein, partial [Ottowia sp.]|nr:DUF4390 domain-containing protein [Ottowia sp.]